MGYRGEDLDLRTSGVRTSPSDIGTWAEMPQQNSRNRGTVHSGPIWVDEDVLACCNQAFDLAVSHRAAEVRLEHLLHAMTRFDAAAEALEEAGVRVTVLRRESAAVVANEIPVAPSGSTGTPRRAEELEEALRIAAQYASARRNGPAGLDDLVQTLLEMRAELPGLGLLRRYAPRSGYSSFGSQPGGYGAEPRTVDTDRRRARVRGDAGGNYYGEPSRALRSDYGGGPYESNQAGRLDQLEQMVWTLGNELTTERRAFANLLHEFQRDVVGQRDEAARVGSGLAERLDAIEQSLCEAISETARALNAVSEKVALIDEGLTSRAPAPVDLEPVTNRLEVIEEAVMAQDGDVTANKLAAIEAAIGSFSGLKDEMRLLASASGDAAEGVRLTDAALEPVLDRLGLLQEASLARASESAQCNTEYVTRLSALEGALEVLTQRVADGDQARAAGVSALHDALVKIAGNQLTFAGSLDQWRLETAGDLETVSNRVDALTQGVARPTQLLEALSGNIESLHRATVERHHRRGRFWYWLFGTDDWVAASWPSQVAAVEAGRKDAKTFAARGKAS